MCRIIVTTYTCMDCGYIASKLGTRNDRCRANPNFRSIMSLCPTLKRTEGGKVVNIPVPEEHEYTFNVCGPCQIKRDQETELLRVLETEIVPMMDGMRTTNESNVLETEGRREDDVREWEGKGKGKAIVRREPEPASIPETEGNQEDNSKGSKGKGKEIAPRDSQASKDLTAELNVPETEGHHNVEDERIRVPRRKPTRMSSGESSRSRSGQSSQVSTQMSTEPSFRSASQPATPADDRELFRHQMIRNAVDILPNFEPVLPPIPVREPPPSPKKESHGNDKKLERK
ncbi:hypothetical protein BDZ45DRAFT_743353 [Acephala macrosclerotiorum]|nr:hypothetical protein BDZ45DRAFT_743353 [Acephala macrosclerotiorum]